MSAASALLDQIEDRVGHSAHLVLIRARDSVGDCTYARYYPEYRRLNHILFASRHTRYVRRGDVLRRDIRQAAKRMYRQPCLMCEWCQRRRKPWMLKT